MTRLGMMLVLTAFLGCSFCSTVLATDTDFFSEILATHQKSTTIRMNFVQSSTSQLFKKPLLSSGVITLQRPNKLRWEYTAPVPSGFVLDGPSGIQWSGSGNSRSLRTTPLSPVLHVIAQQMILWLSADENQLSQDFSLNIQGGECTLTPLQPVMLEYIRSISLNIEQDQAFIKHITVKEPSGNTTKISFDGLEVNPVLDDTLFSRP